MRIKISKKNVRGDFVERVELLSGEDLLLCYQCGKCTSGCPIAEDMDILPSQVIRFCQLGLEEEILNSKTIWLCASCFQCYSRCPKGIDLSSINEALRHIKMGKELDYYGPQEVPDKELEEAPPQALVSVFRKCSL